MAYSHSPRRIDHLVLATRDLAAHEQFFRHLGFVTGARNAHPWGTHNHIVQFEDSFLELIAIDRDFQQASDPDINRFSFAGFIGDYLAARQGGAMIALTSGNAEADSRAFKVMGIGDFEPFHFQRRARSPDGKATEVAFTLAFARSPLLPACGFFSCEHRFPQNFWNPAFQKHANGVTGVEAIVMVAENPADHGEFLSHFSGVREYVTSSAGMAFTLGGTRAQRLEVLTPLAFCHRFGREALPEGLPETGIAGVAMRASDRAALLAALEGSRTPWREHAGAIVVDPAAAFGIALIFNEK